MSLDPDIQSIEPRGWAAPKGYSNGVLARGGGGTLYTAGQIAWDAQQKLVGRGDFAAQFRQALLNVRTVVEAAGGRAQHLVRLTIYVTDKRLYLGALKDVGAAYRDVLGKHFPAMALLEVAGLLEDGALVEIEGTAVLPANAMTARDQ
jgi:enamine deaminase RidA (YjgF/YER057c/UK114 family)